MRTQALKKHFALVVLLGSVLALLLVACTPKTPPPSQAHEGQASLLHSEEEAALLVDEGSEDPSQDGDGDPAPSDDFAASPEQIDVCLNCHSDKEQLIATAAPKVEVVEESEGEG